MSSLRLSLVDAVDAVNLATRDLINFNHTETITIAIAMATIALVRISGNPILGRISGNPILGRISGNPILAANTL
jgi:hypothetical protein